MDNNRHCYDCPIYASNEVTPVRYHPKIRGADIIFIGSQASKQMADSGDPMDGAEAKILDTEMQKHGVDIRTFDYVPPIQCHYDMTTLPSKVNTLVKKQCRKYIDDAFEKNNYKLAVTCSAEAISAIANKSTKVGYVRGVVREDVVMPKQDGTKRIVKVVGITNPRLVKIREEHIPTFTSDVRMLASYINNGYNVTKMREQLDIGQYEMITDLKFLVNMRPEMLAFDIEAVGLRPYEPRPFGRIMTMQFCVDGKIGYTLPWDHPDAPLTRAQKRLLLPQLKKLLQRKDTRVVGQNLKFDKRWISMKLGFEFRVADDTLMMAALLDENSPKGQDDLVKRYVPEMAGYADEFNAKYDKSRMDLIPLESIVQYGGGDVVSCFRLAKTMMPLILADKRLHNYYRNVSMPAINMFSFVDSNGMNIDREAFSTFRDMMQEKVDTNEAELLQQVPRAVRRDHAEKGISFSRSAFTIDVLFKHKAGFKLKPMVYTKTTKNLPAHLRIPSTSSKHHLPYFFEDCPFTAELAQFQKDHQLLTTNLIKFEENYIRDGKIYPVYHLHKTVTGRTSSDDPNGQNIPKRGKYAKAYRRGFVPPSDEWIIMEADLSQAELRIAADMSNDREMIRIYRENGDIHLATAIIVSGLTETAFRALPKKQQKEYRQKAKAVNFGFLYGMGWRTFITYAKTDYNSVFTETEAQDVRARFFSKYNALPQWHKTMREYAHRHGMVRSYSGRIRHLPMVNSREDYIRSDAERQAINSPVQEFSSTMGVVSMTRMFNEIDPNIMRPLAFVHDAIFVLVRKQYADWGARTLKWYMESNDLKALFGVTLKLPIKADVSLGINLGDQHELEDISIDTPYDFTALRNELIEEERKAAEEQNRAPIPTTFPVLPRQVTPPNNGLREALPPSLEPIPLEWDIADYSPELQAA